MFLAIIFSSIQQRYCRRTGTSGKHLLIEYWGGKFILAIFSLKGSYHFTFCGIHESLSSVAPFFTCVCTAVVTLPSRCWTRCACYHRSEVWQLQRNLFNIFILSTSAILDFWSLIRYEQFLPKETDFLFPVIDKILVSRQWLTVCVIPVILSWVLVVTD